MDQPRYPDMTIPGKRELECLSLVSQGYTNAEIGVELGLAEETIKTYIKRILDKLNARSRCHAAAIALRAGIIR